MNKKIQRVGIVGGAVVITLVIVGSVFNIPVLSTGVNTALYPFEKGISFVMNGTDNFFKRFQTVESLLAENEKLKKEVSELKYDNTVLGQYQDENESLKSLLNLKKRFVDYEGTGANVIARDYGNRNKIYTIDKGARQNIKDNNVVLADGGLVGHVDEASQFSSKVIPIIDSRSAVGAQVVRTKDIGILKGDIKLANQGLCVFEINGESEVMKGDQIITSSLSAIYPPGVLIGTVEQVDVSNNNLVSYAYVRPVVDFEHLKQVLVINQENE